MTGPGIDPRITDNQILNALSETERHGMVPYMERVSLTQGALLYQANAETRKVYFPTDALISMVTTMEGGGSVEAALVGNDGVVGSWLAVGIEVAPWTCIVQLAGRALAMDAAEFVRQVAASPALRERVLRHSVALHYLTSQSVGCNRFHDLSARAARWLLMSRERVGTDELHLTHEFLAQMLGVYRPSVTVALGMLEQAGIIGRPRRGMVRILDRRRLEEVSCECFRRVQEQMRVFGAVPDME